MLNLSLARLSFLAAGSLFLAAPSPGLPLSYYLWETGQTGAQTQIDTVGSVNWQFTATWGWTLGGGFLTIKEGPGAVNPITLALWDLTGAPVLLASVAVQAADVTGQYSSVPFLFAAPPTLTAGTPYELMVTSTAPVPGGHSDSYFIKYVSGSAGTFADDTGTGLLPASDPNPPPPASNAPEPSSIAGMAGGLALAFYRLRGQKAKRHASPAGNG